MFKLKKLKKTAIVSCALFSAFSSGLVFGEGVQIDSNSDVSETLSSEFEVDELGVLKSYKGSSKEVIIPENVKSIAFGVFMGRNGIEKVVLPEGLEIIDQYAFFACDSLKEINIPSTVNKIGDLAFGKCESCETVNIGKSVSSFDKFAFWGCKSLKQINVDKENSKFASYSGMLYSKDFSDLKLCPMAVGNEVLLHKNTTSISSYAFLNCSNLERVSRKGSKPISIFDAAFYGCTNFKGVNFGKYVDLIGPGTFTKCASLEEFTIGKNVKTLGSCAFSSCDLLKKVIVRSKNLQIGHKIFKGCPNKITIVADKDSTMATYAIDHTPDLVLS